MSSHNLGMEPPTQAADSEPAPSHSKEPDIMNDPAFDPKSSQENKAEDVDTCRICRGEGSKDEQLFYPCKCSGSIKYVHQNCLVEWLSHSQKKHCELCKTPFRFTKLYDAHMPQSVPLLVFLRQAVIHTSKSVLKWARLHLVVFVWVFWLPWCTRAVWRGLFWLGDGGWIDLRKRNIEQQATITFQSGATASKSPEALATALVSKISGRLLRQWNPLTEFLEAYQDGPLTFRFIRKLFNTWYGPMPANSPSSPAAAFSTYQTPQRPPSLLSNITFLRSLTGSTVLNDIIVDILEGQLITIFVVVVFIVIFLIREWVMQQQQNIQGDRRANQNGELQPRPAIQGQPAAAPQPDGNIRNQALAIQGVEGDPAEIRRDVPRDTARVFARPRGRLHRRATNPEGPGVVDETANTNTPATNNISSSGASAQDRSHDTAHSPSETVQRPAILDGGVMERAMELRRTLDEPDHVDTSQSRSDIQVFKDLWLQADQEPHEVLRIIGDDNRMEELDWIVRFMRYLDTTGYKRPASTASIRSLPDERSKDVSSRTKQDVVDVADSLAPPAPSLSPNVDGRQDAEVPRSTDSLPPVALSVSGTLKGSDAPEFTVPEGEESTNSVQLPEDGMLSSANSPPSNEPDSTPSRPSYTGSSTSTESSANNTNVGIANPTVNDGAGEDTRVSNEGGPSPPDATLPNQPFYERLMDWLWGEAGDVEHQVDPPAEDEERVVLNVAEEAPFVPAARRQQPIIADPDANQGQDPDIVAAAIEAGVDPNPAEGLDEIEDLEGIMELIGMQGPILGLIQNGMFCALLVCLAIGAAVWVPYMFGKFFLTGLAHPLYVLQQPLRAASTSADMLVDFCIFVTCLSYYWMDRAISVMSIPIGWLLPPLKGLLETKILADTARSYAERALQRLALASMESSEFMAKAFDIPQISVLAHESLRLLERRSTDIISWTYKIFTRILERSLSVRDYSDVTSALASGYKGLQQTSGQVISKMLTLPAATQSLLRINPLKFNLATSSREFPIDFRLATWNGRDKFVSILFGYLFFGLLGATYLRVAAAIWGKNKKGRVNGGLADLLYQAGGVMKVVLIISIEMIVFPLYCGLLLDAALLPLFANTSIGSRIIFLRASPNTSLFIHWFVGTCYMFHFALFVSMCRKIMRNGVLFFIRDPDDPTFHPVRDVLERPIITQLWKISFSAVVYGALVLACLGGVVWGVDYAIGGLFPVLWSSSEPILEFPVDILFYNFLMPLAVKFFRPSTGLTSVYSWWFEKSARWLRLSHFLLGHGNQDEEGRHPRQTWKEWLRGDQCQICKTHGELSDNKAFAVLNENSQIKGHEKGVDFIRDGMHVLAPSSDQVRVPKDFATFHPFSDDGQTVIIDEKQLPWYEQNEDSFTKVYIPPFFRLRIAALISLVWAFAAFTGLCVTVLPLLLGRSILTRVVPGHLRMNDVYAFSIGIYILGGLLYATLNYHRFRSCIQAHLTPHATNIKASLRKLGRVSVRFVNIIYTLSAFGVLLPALISLSIQCYIIVPLYTYIMTHALDEFDETLDSTIAFPTSIPATISSFKEITGSQPSRSQPIIHMIQDWTLGILYVKVLGRLILWTAPSRPATALRSIVRDGWLYPDIRLATRGFVLPTTLILLVILGAPLLLAKLSLRMVFTASDAEDPFFRSLIYRYSFPTLMGAALATALLIVVMKAFGRWRRRVRDEVYLIGERLHNYGEARRKKHSKKQRAKAKGKEKEMVERPTSGAVAAERPGLERRETA
ncbi:uncharacterized protein KY384_003004 [Bacidia gigantensis]|uniref:uncharacterized protein n=1 Tax=Bacidia gigantensis TaxID=2732470 RepID=UPI001D03DCF3|nr:uncharacterized protein KY384_003004 [Bacidia gigantensis]KAG8531375.1 hypothetical protein KY384_003004 [Bacidia gigantensis]